MRRAVRSLRRLALAAALTLWAGPGRAQATPSPPASAALVDPALVDPAPVHPAPVDPAQVAPLPEAPPPTWVDQGHQAVSQGLLWTVLKIDRLFADEREVDLPRARSFVRWRTELKLHDDGRAEASASVRAEVRLPSLDRHLSALRLTINGATTRTVDRLAGPDDPQAEAAEGGPSAGLRLDLLDALLTQTDLQAGLLFQIPLGWYTRLRLRHVQPVGGLLLVRAAISGFWETPSGWGTRQDLSLDRPLRPWLLLRLANTGTLTEVSRGWEWGSELALLAAVGERGALFLGGGPRGSTRAGPVAEVWRVHARARRDVWRQWLFLEVEPGLEWTRPIGGGRLRDRWIILRLEVQFEATAQTTAPAVGGA